MGRGGPSPRGWGAPLDGLASRRRKRTIPTRVGSTARARSNRSLPADHPHAGGEHASEVELLLSRKSALKIISVEMREGVAYITADLMP